MPVLKRSRKNNLKRGNRLFVAVAYDNKHFFFFAPSYADKARIDEEAKRSFWMRDFMHDSQDWLGRYGLVPPEHESFSWKEIDRSSMHPSAFKVLSRLYTSYCQKPGRRKYKVDRQSLKC